MSRTSSFAACLLGLVFATTAPAGNVVSVINTGETTVFVDSVKFFVFPQERIVPTPGFGGESGIEDTFRFDQGTEWPEAGLELYYIRDGTPREPWYLPAVAEHDWYNFPGLDDPAKIKFYNASGIAEPGPGEVMASVSAAPSPFTDRTLLRFSLPRASGAKVEIFDASGRLVRTLLDARLPSGAGAATWDGRDGDGRRLPGGVYLARLTSEAGRALARVVLLD